MRITIDFERMRKLRQMSVPDGVNAVRSVKRRVFGGIVHLMDRMDPGVAASLMSVNRELLAAGEAFFGAERKHADAAVDRFKARGK